MQFVIDREKKIFCNKNVVYIVCVSFKCYNSKKKNIRNKTNKKRENQNFFVTINYNTMINNYLLKIDTA